MVGLGNADNTGDLSKPISTATQAALDTKAPVASPTFTGTVPGIAKAMVGLNNVDNTADASKPISSVQHFNSYKGHLCSESNRNSRHYGSYWYVQFD